MRHALMLVILFLAAAGLVVAFGCGDGGDGDGNGTDNGTDNDTDVDGGFIPAPGILPTLMVFLLTIPLIISGRKRRTILWSDQVQQI